MQFKPIWITKLSKLSPKGYSLICSRGTFSCIIFYESNQHVAVLQYYHYLLVQQHPSCNMLNKPIPITSKKVTLASEKQCSPSLLVTQNVNITRPPPQSFEDVWRCRAFFRLQTARIYTFHRLMAMHIAFLCKRAAWEHFQSD